MARRKTILELLDELAPDVRKAFEESIAAIRSDLQFQKIVDALARGDIDAAMRAISLGPEHFTPLDRALTASYQKAGDWAMAENVRDAKRQGYKLIARFDGRNPVAETWLREQSSKLIVKSPAMGGDALLPQQRADIRGVLERNMREGVNPRRAALDVVGRMSGGRRVGGIVGLDSKQIQYVDTVRAELVSGDPRMMRNYLNRKARDRRFDSVVNAAIRDGKAVPGSQAEKMVGRYSDKMLQIRGERIARTELLDSLHAAQDEAMRQLIERGEVTAEQVTETWDASEDGDTRPSHRAMDGQKRQRGVPFRTGNGYLMMRPGDRSLGAPAEEIIQCRCRKVQSVDWVASLSPEDLL